MPTTAVAADGFGSHRIASTARPGGALRIGLATRRCRPRLRRGLGEGIEHCGNEGRHVLGPSARDEVPVPDDVLIKPGGIGVHQVVPDAGPGGESPSIEESRGCKHPRPMTQRDDGLVTRSERAYELSCLGGLPEQVRIDEPAG